ncbi:MAG TPA: hypothetical protein VFU02_05565 [Polyangiaceae bacterium]|nr:hypothetical protein [Polyangiaceae bacterium]
MHAKWLPTLLVQLSIGIMGCGSSTPETSDSGATSGSSSAGSLTGNSSTSGSATTIGGTTTGVTTTGATTLGGTTTSGTTTGVTTTGGTTTSGTTTSGTTTGVTTTGATTTGGAGGGTASGSNSSTGGSDGGGGSGGSTGGPGDVRPSNGCSVSDGAEQLTAGGSSVARGLPTSVRLSVNSGGSNREYIIDIPADYDPTHPYRLIFSWHQAYGSAEGNANGQYPAVDGPNFDAENYAYFGLHREATEANQPAIFVAPQGIGNFPWDFTRDVALFDDLLALVTDNLCIDESRVFTTGFSFGAMMSYSLSITRQTKLRGAVTMAAANYNLPGQPEPSDAGPVAYFGITGMSDGTCPWVSNDQQKRGGKYCALAHAEANGCTIPGEIQTAMVGSREYLCYDFEGCQAGYPVKVCTFDGGHTPSSVSDGMSGGDDGRNAFVPPLAWQFITQF